MMKVNVSSTKLKGSVLYTVVSVLMVLIVFLMGTLALAATASNRAYSNYQKEQTEYTARALLDSVIHAINNDNTTSGIKSQMISRIPNKGNTFDVEVEMDGTTHLVTVTNDGPRTLYNKEAEEWQTGNIYEIATTVDRKLANSTFAAYIMGDSTTVTTPSGGGGAFVSLGDTGGTEIGTGGYVTGGTYIGIGIPAKSYTIGVNGESTIEAPFFANGDLTNVNKFHMVFKKTGDYFAVTGDFNVAQASGIAPNYVGFEWGSDKYEDLPAIYVGETFSITAAHVTIGTDEVATNIYCGNLEVDSSYSLKLYGDLYTFDSTALNTIGGTAEPSQLYEWTARTLKKESGNATIGSWYSKGSVYTKGNSGNPVDIHKGDLRVEKNITIEGVSTITGDVVSGGMLFVKGELTCGNVYADTLVVEGTLTCDSIKVNHILGTGTINCDRITYVDNDLDITKYVNAVEDRKVTWYEGLQAQDHGQMEQYGPNIGSYSVTEHVKIYYTDNTFVETTNLIEVTGLELWNGEDVNNRVPDVYKVNTSEANTTLIEAIEKVPTPTGNNSLNMEEPRFIKAATITDVETKYNQPIYPEEYTNANISQNILSFPVVSDYTDYPTTPEELKDLQGLYDPETKTYNENIIYGPNSEAIAVRDPNNSDSTNNNNLLYYEVKNTCVLTGDFAKNIYINPDAGNPITVVLKDMYLNLDYGIIVNDHVEVILLVSGTVKLNGCGIITNGYCDLIFGEGQWTPTTSLRNPAASMKEDLIIEQQQSPDSKKYPNVIIYGVENSVLDLYADSKTMVTALVRAPKMTYKQGIPSEAAKSITYKLTESSQDGVVFGAGAPETDGHGHNKGIGLIGQLVADHIMLTNDGKWGMIYVNDGGASARCGCGCAECTGSPSTCKCECGDEDCICTGGSGMVIPDRFVPLYYNYY